MEKAHGYEYKRTRSVRGKTRQGSGGIRKVSSPRAGPSRARIPSQASTPAQVTTSPPPPQSETSSAYTTPMMGIDGSVDSSPSWGLDISPRTIQECSPEVAPLNFFPPLPFPRRDSPPVGISPACIQSPDAVGNFEPVPYHLRNPAVAVEAISTRHSDVSEYPIYSQWASTSVDYCLNPNANRDVPLGGEDLSPASDFAETFLRDAPRHVWEGNATPAIDPELPVVPNDRYDPSRDHYY